MTKHDNKAKEFAKWYREFLVFQRRERWKKFFIDLANRALAGAIGGLFLYLMLRLFR